MLPPKLRHILGCSAFSDFFSSCQRRDPTKVKSHLKIQWEIHLLKRLLKTKHSKKIQSSNYIRLYLNTAFGNNFGPREVPQTIKRMKVKVQVFLFGHFPGSNIESEGIFF